MFCTGDFRSTASCIEIDLLELCVERRGRNPISLQLCRIEDDADFPADATFAFDGCHAAYRQQPFGDHVVDIPGQFLQRHVGRLGAEIGDGAAIDINALNLRFQDAGR